MSRGFLPAVLTALAIGVSMPVLAKDKEDGDRQKELDQARKELLEAREELKRATADLARVTREMQPDSPKAQAWEYMTNPRRAMLGVGVAAGPERKGDTHGVLITAVTPGSGAEKAGLKSGDILTSANGRSLLVKKGEKPGPERKLRGLMSELKPGDKVELDYEREGKTAHATAIAQRPDKMDWSSLMDEDDLDIVVPPIPPIPPVPPIPPIPPLEGLQLVKLDPDLASYFQAKDGVLVTRAPKDGDLGLKTGDVIQKVNGEAVDSPIEAMDRLRDAGDKEISVEVLRHGKRETLKGKSPLKQASRRRIEIHSDDEEP